jgi:hypothetical protein
MSQKPPIDGLHGVPPEVRERLAQMGIRTFDQFITRAVGPQGRMLARELGLDARQLGRWASRVDAAKAAAAGQELAKLLAQAGIAKGKELQGRIPPDLPARASAAGAVAAQEIKKRAPSRAQIDAFMTSLRKKQEP